MAVRPLALTAALIFYAAASLFLIAAFMTRLALQRDIARWCAWLVILGNAGWVAGSVLVLVLFSPTTLGCAFVITQAVIVAFLAELEYYGLRRIES